MSILGQSPWNKPGEVEIHSNDIWIRLGHLGEEAMDGLMKLIKINHLYSAA